MALIFWRKKGVLLTTIIISFASFQALSGLAATATVLVGSGGSVFTPAITNISVGDQVTWTWSGNVHSSTSTNAGLWDSGVHNVPFTFSHTFPSSGVFFYYCTIHGNSAGAGMAGRVVVAAPNTPPTVSITNPAANAVFAAPANVTIQATATDSDGTITNVQFVVGTTVLTNDNAAPFAAITNNLAAGTYTLSAIASDDTGARTTNALSISVVAPVTTALTAPVRVPPTNFQFSYSANTGLRYVVQRSTNLLSTNWASLITNTASSSAVIFVDTNATGNPGFYRVGRLPNP